MNKFALFILFTIIVLISSLERFRVIQDFPSYEVSNKGRIRHVKHRRILKTGLSNSGYRLLSIRVDGKAFTLNTHRLVAKEWCPNPENKPCVDHIDGNTQNNNISNLRWATVAENTRNVSKHRNSTSKYKGVSKCGNKWLVHIRNQHVGLFNDEKEAAIAYNNHAKEHFGVFAKLNHID